MESRVAVVSESDSSFFLEGFPHAEAFHQCYRRGAHQLACGEMVATIEG